MTSLTLTHSLSNSLVTEQLLCDAVSSQNDAQRSTDEIDARSSDQEINTNVMSLSLLALADEVIQHLFS